MTGDGSDIKGNGFRPGWGPLDGGQRHWSRPDFRQACDPECVTSYGGNTHTDLDVKLGECCPTCVVVVLHARQVLG